LNLEIRFNHTVLEAVTLKYNRFYKLNEY